MEILENALNLSAKDHKRIAAFVEKEAGIQLPDHKRKLIETRLRKRVKATGRASISDYLDFTLSPAGAMERVAMIDVITTNKTDFFREVGHFDFLTSYLSERLEQWQRGRVLKVWSAACSSGEEPYTLAMVLQEIKASHVSFDYHIRATDICTTVLAKAKTAVYPMERIAPVALPLRKKYLLKSRKPEQNLIKIAPDLRQKVSFEPFNLITGEYPAPGSIDVIFCRNVMIYFSGQDRTRVVDQLSQSLTPGGLLFLGHSESVGDKRGQLTVAGPTVYQRAN